MKIIFKYRDRKELMSYLSSKDIIFDDIIIKRLNDNTDNFVPNDLLFINEYDEQSDPGWGWCAQKSCNATCNGCFYKDEYIVFNARKSKITKLLR